MRPLRSLAGRELRMERIANSVQGWRKLFTPAARLELLDGEVLVATVHWEGEDVPVGTTAEGSWRFAATGWWYRHSSRTIPTVIRPGAARRAELARFKPTGVLGWFSFPRAGRLVSPDGPDMNWAITKGWSSSDGAPLVRFLHDRPLQTKCVVEQRGAVEPALPVLVTLGMYLVYREDSSLA